MKKFLLSVLCAAAALAGSAAEFTYSVDLAKGDLTGTSATVNGVEWTYGALGNWDGNTLKGYQIGTKSNPVASWSLSTDAFANATITKVTVTAATAKDCAATLEVNVGGSSFGTAEGDFAMTLATATVTGSAKGNLEIKLVNSTEEGKAKAMYIKGWTVTYTADEEIGGETPVVPPTPAETEGQGTAESPYTVADLAKLNNPGTTAWVTGVIVGCYNYDEAAEKNVFSSTELTTNSNIAIATSASSTDYVALQIKQADVRAALNLVDNRGNIGKTVTVQGELIKYISDYGVKSVTAYTLDGETPTPPTPVETVGDGTDANPYTVADVIALNNVGTTGPEAWITGFIVGTFNGKSLTDFTSATGAGASASNLAIAATANETDHTKMVPVALPAGDVRAALNLQDRPALLGREVSLKGNLMAYFGAAGVKNTSDYSVVGGLPEISVKETESLTTFVEEQDTENFYKIKGAVTVFYQSPNKQYTFITDGTSNLQVYGALPNAYTNGDVLTGIIGKFGEYNKMPQMTPQADSFGEATKGEAVAPTAKALADVQIAEYVTLSNVDIVEVPAAEEGKASTWNVVDGEETRQLFDRFKIGDINAAKGVTIVGIGSIFGENPQIFPVEIDYDNSAISEISAAANGQTVVYDLQGRRLAAPVKGINIINGKKVLVK